MELEDAPMEKSQCVTCEAVLYEPVSDMRDSCPVCQDTRRRFDVTMKDTVAFYAHTRIRGKRAGSNKIAFDSRSGASYFRKEQVWHHLVRQIDRENNRYVETITVLATGELVRHVDEPLTDHIGHGSDREQASAGSTEG